MVTFIPVVSTEPNDVDIYSFMTFDGGSTYYGVVSGQNFGDLDVDPSEEDGPIIR